MEAPANLPAFDHVPGDAACLTCGYNLRSLPISGVCPECGHEVEETLRNALIYADPLWLERVRSGARMLALTPLVWLSAFLGLAVLTAMTGGALVSVLAVMGTAGLILAFLIYVAGVLEFTCEPADDPCASRWTPGVLARFCPLALVILVAAAFALGSVGSEVLAGFGAVLIFVVLLVWAALLAVHGERLARRAAERRVARWARAISVAAFVTAGLGLAINLTVLIWLQIAPGVQTFPPAWLSITLSMDVLALPCILVFLCGLMRRIARLLDRALTIAQAFRAVGQ